MKNKSILLIGVICASLYIIFSLLLLYVVYIIDLFEITIVLGVLYGIAVIVITRRKTTKETIKAKLIGICCALSSQIVLSVLAIPSRIILHILRYDEFVQDTGRLTTNELIGYSFGTMLLWWGMMMTLVISVIIDIGVSVFYKIKKR